MPKSSDSIISGLEVNPEKDIIFSKPKVNSNGEKNIGILNAATKKSFNLSTPLMLTWGLNEKKPFDGKTGRTTYDFTLQFPNEQYSSEATTQFLKNLEAFEKHIKKSAVKNSLEWFGKEEITSEEVDSLWTPMVKYPKNPETGEFDYSRKPQIRVKVPLWNGKFDVEMYDPEQKLLFPNDNGLKLKDLITKGSQMASVLQCGGILLTSGRFGVTWRLFKAVIKPKESLKGKCHISLGKGDKKKLLGQPDSDEHVKEKEKVVVVVEDSDEEEEEKVVEDSDEEEEEKVVEDSDEEEEEKVVEDSNEEEEEEEAASPSAAVSKSHQHEIPKEKLEKEYQVLPSLMTEKKEHIVIKK